MASPGEHAKKAAFTGKKAAKDPFLEFLGRPKDPDRGVRNPSAGIAALS